MCPLRAKAQWRSSRFGTRVLASPKIELPRIFERFERAASTRHYGGMGLGLYVARQIAQAHGGTIAGANLPDGGVRFTVRLPLVPPASKPLQ